jgi:hypothetical protein
MRALPLAITGLSTPYSGRSIGMRALEALDPRSQLRDLRSIDSTRIAEFRRVGALDGLLDPGLRRAGTRG